MIVVKGGLLTTVQDLGRWGYQSFGVSVAGPMDRISHRFANLLVGNSASAAVLEITLLGPDIEFQEDVRCAVAGAEFEVFVDDNRMPRNAAWPVPKGARLRFGDRRRGARAYLARRRGHCKNRYRTRLCLHYKTKNWCWFSATVCHNRLLPRCSWP